MKMTTVMKCGSVLLVALISVFLPCLSYGHPLDTWHWRSPLPRGDHLRAITYGNGIFVAVGDAGTIVTSPDAMAWTERVSGTFQSLSALSFGNGTFVAVGFEGTILTSMDGITWTARSSGTTMFLWGVAYGNNTFVAVGGVGTILASPDGITWTDRTFEACPVPLNGICFANGLFVAVGDYGTILTSPNGVSWTPRSGGCDVMQPPTMQRLVSVTFGNGIFLAMGEFYTIVASADGITWTTTVDEDFSTPYRVSFADGIFFGFGGFSPILSSSDGLDWVPQDTGSTTSLGDVAFGNNTFVAVGTFGTILTSPDAINWTDVTPGRPYNELNELTGVTLANGVFFAVGQASLTSYDGRNWTHASTPGTVSYGNGIFAAGSGRDGFFYSYDGIVWTQANSYWAWVYRLAFGNGTFVAVGGGMGWLTSPDGVNWTHSQFTGDFLASNAGIVFGDGIFVAVGQYCEYVPSGPVPIYVQRCRGKVITSPDGHNWTDRTPGTIQELAFNPLSAVTYGNGMFVAVGEQGTIITSPDGVIWTERVSTSSNHLTDVAYGNGFFLAVGKSVIGDSGNILSSPDGVVWTDRVTGIPPLYKLTGVASGNGTFVIVGDHGMIIQSDPFLGDVSEGHWAEQFIITLYESGITGGCGNGNYCPDDPITRAQMAVFLISTVYGGEPVCNGSLPCKDTTPYFTDVPPDHWAFKFIQKMAEVGITGGCSATDFCPDTNVMRLEMAVFMTTGLRARPEQMKSLSANALSEVPQAVCTGNLFNDVNSGTVGEDFCRFIEDFSALGITGGCQADDPLTPDVNEARYCWRLDVTRAQMAVFLGRAFLGM